MLKMKTESKEESKNKKILYAIAQLDWNITENYRSRIVFDLLKMLKAQSKTKFLSSLNYLLAAQSFRPSPSLEYILSSLNDAEGDEFLELASAFVGGLLLVKCKN